MIFNFEAIMKKMARYAEILKNRVVAKLLPPESASVSAIAKEIGVTMS
jgi:hypothetical protein